MDESAYRDLISGDRRGARASFARAGLAALSAFYGIGARARNVAFDSGCKRCSTAGVPVVSVGNITVGGTGKTPVVAFLTQWFLERGLRPVILSRGYRSLANAANDEKLVLDRLCPGVIHLQQPDRVASARRAVEEYGAQVLILDDGFQHRRLRRDLDLVLIDASNPFGHGRLLPRGLLREPLSGLRRADLVVITRADRSAEESRSAIRATIAPHRPAGEVPIEIAFPSDGYVASSGKRAELIDLRNENIAAFCGIGNPDAFRATLAEMGTNVVHWRTFPDHHHYTPDELRELATNARERGATACVTTLKDLVKIETDELEGLPVWAVNIGVRILQGADAIEEKLESLRSPAP